MRAGFAVLAAVMVACQAAPLGSTETGTPSPSAPPAVSSPTPADLDFAADSFVRVVTDALRVRPDLVLENFRESDTPLRRGQGAIVLDGPAQHEGYRWYLLYPYVDGDATETELPIGWVKAGSKDGEAWLEQDDVCRGRAEPEFWDDDALGSIALQRDLACFGDRISTVTGRLANPEGCGGAQAVRTEPAWFDNCTPGASLYLRKPNAHEWEPRLRFAVHPEADVDDVLVAGIRNHAWVAEDGPIVQATGQLDHPEARACRKVATQGDGAAEGLGPDPAVWVYGCRTTFVVTKLAAVEP